MKMKKQTPLLDEAFRKLSIGNISRNCSKNISRVKMSVAKGYPTMSFGEMVTSGIVSLCFEYGCDDCVRCWNQKHKIIRGKIGKSGSSCE